MAFAGRLHPLLLYFPIALIIVAAVAAAALVGVTGHLGARLVWGADFLRP
jgi:hypothetical protein